MSTKADLFNMGMQSYTKSHTFHISKTIRAPLRFVYDWCTDYRESDPKITGSKAKRKILLKNKHRVVYVMNLKRGSKKLSAVDVVTLHPRKWWHLDFIGDEDDDLGDYVLTSLGPRKTRLDITLEAHYKIRRPPSKEEDAKGTREVWDKYVAALERDYTRERTRQKS